MPADEHADSLQRHIRGAVDSLSASERKVARVVLTNYPIAGLETVSKLAERARVSPPTVIRFVHRLGFSGYPEFQRTLQSEVHVRLGSPLEQYGRGEVLESGTYLEQAGTLFTRGITDSFRELPQSEVDAAVELLIDPKRTIRLIGGRFSGMLANYLSQHLRLLRPKVETPISTEIERLSALSDTGRNHVTVVFDYRRYDYGVVDFAEKSAARGSEIILFTDRGLSPAADFAAVAIPTVVDSPSPFDTMVPALAAIETLIARITAKLGEAGRSRIAEIEQMRSDSLQDELRQ